MNGMGYVHQSTPVKRLSFYINVVDKLFVESATLRPFQ